MQDDDRKFYRRTELAKRYGVASYTILRWANDPSNAFPASVKLGPGTTVWAKEAIDQFERQQLGVPD